MSHNNQLAEASTDKLSDFLQSDKSIKLFQEALNIDTKEKSDEAVKFASSMMLEIQRTIGGKSDITQCTPQSIRQAMIDSIKLGLIVDKRQHAHLIPRGKKVGNNYIKECQLEIGFRGYIAALTKNLKQADFTIEPVYEGDTFAVNDASGFQTYSHTKSNPFRNHKDLNDLHGLFCCITFMQGDELYSKTTFMSESELKDIIGTLKQDYIWKAWPIEMRKKTVIKRACKVLFSNLVDHLDAFDNKNHDMNKEQVTQEIETAVTADVTDELAQIANSDDFDQDKYDEAADKAKDVTTPADDEPAESETNE